MSTTEVFRRPAIVEYALFLRALPLVRRAQKVRTEPLQQVIESLTDPRRSLARHSEDQLALAAGRATARWSRWFGGIDTCLTRSLVLGALSRGRGDVKLVIGFRAGESEDAIAGHAWVTIDGRPVGPDANLAGDTYQRSLEVPFIDRASDRRRPG